MNGGPGYHGWTHRPASQGGTDPIPGSVIPYAYVSRSGQVSVTSTTSYNVDATVMGSSGSGNTNDADTFEIYTDINGDVGIHLLRTGVYHFHWSVLVQENNASNLIPTKIDVPLQVMTQTHVDASYGFEDVPSNFKNPTDHALAQYIGSGATAANDYVSIHAAWSVPTTDLNYYTPRIVSTGGTGNWRYGSAAGTALWLWATRIGDI